MCKSLGESIQTALNRAIEFFIQHQLPSGEYRTYISHQRRIPDTASVDSSMFTTTFVVYACEFVQHPGIPEMQQKALNFLRREMSEPGMWRYWSSESHKQIDPDLDDTACVSYVLQRASPKAAAPPNAEIFLRNRNAEGLFYTWIRAPGSRNDIDSIVNANVLLYLGEIPETRPVCAYLNRLILDDQESDSYWYYADILFMYYAISRTYFHGISGLAPCLAEVQRKTLMLQQPDGSFGSSLRTGLALSTLVHLDIEDCAIIERGITSLVNSQHDDGSWERAAAFTGPEAPLPRSVYFGSEELTTALCVEALAKYQLHHEGRLSC